MTPDIAMYDYHQGQVILPEDAYKVGEKLSQMQDIAKHVGDINSTAKGSAARYNSGKVPLELIPLRVLADHFNHLKMAGGGHFREVFAIEALGAFQEGGGIEELHEALSHLDIQWEDCAAVFDYGRKKYAEWNWAKGMAWSIPIACAARHIVFGLMRGEKDDPESGLSHKGHVACNIVMLLTYMRTFPEGDDRPKGLI